MIPPVMVERNIVFCRNIGNALRNHFTTFPNFKVGTKTLKL